MKISENVKFLISFGVVPWIPFYILYKHYHCKQILIFASLWLILTLCGICSRRFTMILKSICSKTGGFLGKYIAIFVLSVVYILAVFPTGLLMKIVKRDRLRLRKTECKTYWLDYDYKNTDYEYQF